LVTDIFEFLSNSLIFYFTGKDALVNSASLLTFLSILASLVGYFLKKDRDEKNERKKASKSLHIELDDTLEALQYENHPRQFTGIILKDNTEAQFMNRALNHDFYDSMIFSGKINFLSSKIYQETQDIFQKIKDHNFYIRKIRDIEDNAYLHEDLLLKTERYYRKLEATENELKTEIPKLKEKLKEKFKFD